VFTFRQTQILAVVAGISKKALKIKVVKQMSIHFIAANKLQDELS